MHSHVMAGTPAPLCVSELQQIPVVRHKWPGSFLRSVCQSLWRLRAHLPEVDPNFRETKVVMRVKSVVLPLQVSSSIISIRG